MLFVAGMLSLLSLVVTAGVGSWGMWQSNRGLQAQQVATQAMHSGMLADMMHDGIRADVTLAVLVALDPTAGDQASVAAGMEENIATLTENLAALVALPLPADLAQAAAVAVTDANGYAEAARAVVAAAAMGPDAAKAALPGFDASFDVLLTSMEDLAGKIEAFSAETGATAIGQNRSLMITLLVVSAVTAVLTIFGSHKGSQQVTVPITRLREALSQVAAGDFSVRIGEITRNDDIGSIARDIDQVTALVESALAEQEALRQAAQQVIDQLSLGLQALADGNLTERLEHDFGPDYEALRLNFNRTIEELGAIIRQVVSSAGGIHRLTSDLNRASENLSSRSVSQAATLEETAAALEELTSSVREAAETAARVESEMSSARTEAEESGRIVTNAVAAMGEISRSAQHITQIIGVIDDIAFQTNLLALNAGVEAARAGEAGKGFAVVASEVRALAQRSSQAAREIKDLIGSSTEHIHRGVDQVNKTGEALSTVVGRVSEMARMVSAIAAAAAEQSRGLSEINSGVAQLDQVTQQNAAMAEDAGNANLSLSQQADHLAQLVARFRTSEQVAMPAQGMQAVAA
jgi:methyl-accepting chemotaxis protein